MILPDANLLIYACNRSDPRFEAAQLWLQKILSGSETVCLCWETINAFIRISTNPKAIPSPIPLEIAFDVVNEWLGLANVVIISPTDRHFEVLREISLDAKASGTLHSDAILATLAITHNATIASTDRDFRLFKGLELINPLAH